MFNRNLSYLLAVAMAVIVLSTHAGADATADARKAIQAQYNRANAAAAKKDIKGYLAILTPDRTSLDEKGNNLTMEQYRQLNTMYFQNAISMNATTVVQTISVKGTTATVHVKEHDKLAMMNTQTKKPSTMVADTVADDIWVKTGSTWLQKRSVEKSASLTLDGKKVDR